MPWCPVMRPAAPIHSTGAPSLAAANRTLPSATGSAGCASVLAPHSIAGAVGEPHVGEGDPKAVGPSASVPQVACPSARARHRSAARPAQVPRRRTALARRAAAGQSVCGRARPVASASFGVAGPVRSGPWPRPRLSCAPTAEVPRLSAAAVYQTTRKSWCEVASTWEPTTATRTATPIVAEIWRTELTSADPVAARCPGTAYTPAASRCAPVPGPLPHRSAAGWAAAHSRSPV